LAIGKVGPEHQQDVAVAHCVIAGGETNEPGHADIVRVLPFDMLFAAQRMHHRRIETRAERDELVVRALASRAAQDGDAVVLAIEQRGKAIEIGSRRRYHRRARQQPLCLGGRRIGRRLQGDVARDDHDGHATLADRFVDGDLENPRHLFGAGDQLAIMTAFLEKRLRVCLLEITAADLGRGDVGGDAEHRDPRAMTIEQSIDEVQIAGSAAACADGEFSRQMRLGAGRECGDLLMAYVEPLDLAVAAHGIGQSIEAVADDAIDALDTRGSQRFHELVSNDLCHDAPFRSRVSAARASCPRRRFRAWSKPVRRCGRANRISIMPINEIASPCLSGLVDGC
jgi:hypothetical protein